MTENDAVRIAQAFVAAINAHDVEAISSLMTEDHRFVDAAGNEVGGRETLRPGWEGYFRWFPDYWITCSTVVAEGAIAALFGRAGGSYGGSGRQEDQWDVPAAWLATISDGKVAEWRVYCDIGPQMRVIEAHQR